jgi:hypothetical protein
MREPMWDRLWDASTWTSGDLVSWLQRQEDDSFKVEWPLEPATNTVKAMATEYTGMNFSAAGLSKEALREKLGRAKAIRKLLA